MKASGVSPDLLEEIGQVLTWPATEGQILEAMKLVPDDVVQMITASGTPAEVKAKVREYISAGATCPILYPLGEDVRLMERATGSPSAPVEAGEPSRIALPGSRRVISPRSEGQRRYVEAIDSFEIVISIGPAGTGKTYLAVAKAVEALYRKRVRRIVLARPAVEAGENLGFLPGDLQEKVDPYLRPLYDALEDMMPPERVRRALDDRTIEIAPLAYMRGRTLSDAFVILDEAQNATRAQMKMFLTRLGLNSRVVITGDKTQIDLPNRADSGLLQVENILRNVNGIALVYLDAVDVIRHRLVKHIIRAYEKDTVEGESG